jgi:hypothetical protein
MKAVSVVLLVLGLISLGTSAVWTKIAPKPPAMSEEKADLYMKAAGDLHNAPSQDDVPAEQKAILEEVAKASQRAQNVEKIGKSVFKIGGIVLSLAGAGLYFWASKAAE